LRLAKHRYGVAIAWERAKATVDLDLQAVIVDNNGLIVDAVYYNNLMAMNGCIGHSGDGQNLNKQAYSETVWVNLKRLPPQVALIIFVVAAYGDCMLKDVTGGKIVVLEDWVGCRVQETRLERVAADVDVVQLMRRCENGEWELVEVDEPAMRGSHFLDILEPTIGDIIRKEIAGAPANQKVTFLMEKGCAVDFAETSAMKRLVVGISGKLPSWVSDPVDIDVSAVFFSKAGKVIGAVDCDSPARYGVQHTGDNDAGTSIGDDEAITLDLAQLPKKVKQVFFVLNMQGGANFRQIESAYARIADQTCTELARYEILGGTDETGLLIARIFRAGDRRWSLQALGLFCRAERWEDAVPVMETVFHEPPERSTNADEGEGMIMSRRFSDPEAAVEQGCAGGPGDEPAPAVAEKPAASPTPAAGAALRKGRTLCFTALRSEGSSVASGAQRGAQSEPVRSFCKRQALRKGSIRLVKLPNAEGLRAAPVAKDGAAPEGGAKAALSKLSLGDQVPFDDPEGAEPQGGAPRAGACGNCIWPWGSRFLAGWAHAI